MIRLQPLRHPAARFAATLTTGACLAFVITRWALAPQFQGRLDATEWLTVLGLLAALSATEESPATNDALRLFVAWMLAAAAAAMGAALLHRGLSAIAALGLRLYGGWTWTITGQLLIGLGQWLVLRRWVRLPDAWIVLPAMGAAASLGAFEARLPERMTEPVILAVVLGAQALLLRRAGVSPRAWIVAGIAGGLLTRGVPLAWNGDLPTGLFEALNLAAAACSGLALVETLGRPGTGKRQPT